MPIVEHVIRYRCAVCKVAVEFFSTVNIPALPCKANSAELTFPPAPAGWTIDAKGLLHCAEHPEQLVKPASVIPATYQRH